MHRHAWECDRLEYYFERDHVIVIYWNCNCGQKKETREHIK